jgi:hypothetical protein
MVVKHTRELMIIPTDSPVTAQLRSSTPSPLVDNQFAALQQGNRNPAQLRLELGHIRAQMAEQIAKLSALEAEYTFSVSDVVGYVTSSISMLSRAMDRVR